MDECKPLMAGSGNPRQGAVRVEEMAAGAWAGLVGTILGYPLDVVKSRMQVGKGSGFVPTLVNVVAKEAGACTRSPFSST